MKNSAAFGLGVDTSIINSDNFADGETLVTPMMDAATLQNQYLVDHSRMGVWYWV